MTTLREAIAKVLLDSHLRDTPEETADAILRLLAQWEPSKAVACAAYDEFMQDNLDEIPSFLISDMKSALHHAFRAMAAPEGPEET